MFSQDLNPGFLGGSMNARWLAINCVTSKRFYYSCTQVITVVFRLGGSARVRKEVQALCSRAKGRRAERHFSFDSTAQFFAVALRTYA
ncbi:hypothetical protein R1flu_021388 [Riccia fluitans]|uniref:Uncharacterized protein n=1 Tax=Riccia fluitans TaxID=41844 RepID=A0ABD1ZPK1_9MARC